MKKLILRLVILMLSVYLAGNIISLYASSGHAPAPSAPAPAPAPPAPAPPAAPPQIDAKSGGPQGGTPALSPSGGGCCGGGGGTTTPSEPAKPGESVLSGMETIGNVYDGKGDEAKKAVDAAYSKARRILLDKVAAKYNPQKINRELDAVNAQIYELKSKLDPIETETSKIGQKRYNLSLAKGKLEPGWFDEDRPAWNKLNARDAELEKQAAPMRQELEKLKAKKAALEKQLTDITQTEDYQKEAARIDAAIAAGKAKRYQAIDAQVKKAKTNAISKFMGAKIPEGSTSSYDIEASVPSVGSLVQELSAGK